MKIVLIIILVGFASLSAHAQASRDDPFDPAGGTARNQQGLSNPADELRYRAAVKHEEESHREMVERAEQIGEIGGELLKSFERQKSLTRDDLKRLERMEKLVRKIRGSAGGSDPEIPLESPPAQLNAALERLSELSSQLNESVKKTSRMVVSATVIERSSELIELIKFIRTFGRP